MTLLTLFSCYTRTWRPPTFFFVFLFVRQRFLWAALSHLKTRQLCPVPVHPKYKEKKITPLFSTVSEGVLYFWVFPSLLPLLTLKGASRSNMATYFFLAHTQHIQNDSTPLLPNEREQSASEKETCVVCADPSGAKSVRLVSCGLQVSVTSHYIMLVLQYFLSFFCSSRLINSPTSNSSAMKGWVHLIISNKSTFLIRAFKVVKFGRVHWPLCFCVCPLSWGLNTRAGSNFQDGASWYRKTVLFYINLSENNVNLGIAALPWIKRERKRWPCYRGQPVSLNHHHHLSREKKNPVLMTLCYQGINDELPISLWKLPLFFFWPTGLQVLPTCQGFSLWRQH